jgi:hypothetical protein
MTCHFRGRIACLRDRAIGSGLYELPPGALVYRLGKAQGCLYRCARLALFAVAD